MLPSALLLVGPTGLGKAPFAQALTQAALCMARTAEHFACGQCHACRLFVAMSHPDVRFVDNNVEDEQQDGATQSSATSATRFIQVQRIRELREFHELSSHLGRNKVIVIDPADRLHPSAANALLKTLEEPTPGTVFMLLSARPQQLLPTIRSRCFRLDFRIPPAPEAMQWLREQGVAEPAAPLAYAGGAPLAALELARSATWRRRQEMSRLLSSREVEPGTLARAVESDELPWFCVLLYKWCADLISVRLTRRVRYNPDYAQSLAELAVNLDVLKLQRLMKELTVQLRYLEHPLNQKLVAEQAALTYVRAVSSQEH